MRKTRFSQAELEEIVKLSTEDSLPSRVIAKMFDCGKTTINDFLSKKTHHSFWEALEGFIEDEGDGEDIGLLCDSADKDVANLAKRLRTAQRTNTQLRRALNGRTDTTQHLSDMLAGVERATRALNVEKGIPKKTTDKHAQKREDAVAEILFSDYQIGKVGQHYNSKLAEMAIKRYSNKVLSKLVDQDKYNFTKIVIGSIGDLVEDHLKHGVQSATSTDSGLSEQMANAISHMWKYIIKPIGDLGIPVEVICIAGNHGSSQHKGMDMFKAGLYSYDYTIYKALEGYCDVIGFDHVKFVIPEGCFGYTTIFGRLAVYEHGYFNSCTEKSLEDQCKKRGQQLKRHVDYFRCGDMHHLCNFDNGRLVVNGAFFGTDTEGVEYSGILGFSAIPAQVMMVHTDEKSLGRNTVKEIYNIQVADGY